MAPPRKYHTDEERREARREINRRYSQSEKGRAATKRTNHGPKAQARFARYRETPGYAAAQERYHASERWREVSRAASQRARETQPDRIRARAALWSALRHGRVVRPEHCYVCLLPKRLDAHHHLGYEPQHWLDVLWLCRRCHKAAHI